MDSQHLDPFHLTFSKFFRAAQRTVGEQIAGLFISSLFCFTLFYCLDAFFFHKHPISNYPTPPWAFWGWETSFAWASSYFFLSLSIWSLWRRFSFKTLKIELSLFAAQLLFFLFWKTSFYLLHQYLLSLVSLLFLWTIQLALILLFWKKDPLAALLTCYPFIWIFYVMTINMGICIFS